MGHKSNSQSVVHGPSSIVGTEGSGVRVARVEDVPPGVAKLVRVGNTPVVLINEEGKIYALYGLCSHQHRSLEGGTVWRGVLDCPWHRFQWDIRTGENVYPRNVYPLNAMPHLEEQVRTLPTYRATVVDGYIEVEIEPESPLE
jgi:nitrite reductase/ring-hydroxylating ferredoxin subunit